MSETQRPRRMGRSLGALLTGFVTVVILSLGTDIVLHAISIFPPLGQPMANALLLLATASGTAEAIAVLVGAGVCMGIANANLTDLALALGSADRRVTTGAFNVIRWGFAAPAPVVAGLLAENVGLSAPFWAGVGVLGAGLVTFLAAAHVMASGVGERVLWSGWNRAARALDGAPEQAVGEA